MAKEVINEQNQTNTIQIATSTVKILEIYFSYDENKNKHFNFDLKIQKLQTKLDLWKAKSLTLFGEL